jgi:tRNA(Arg) A34 adenosine deaminase TadA
MRSEALALWLDDAAGSMVIVTLNNGEVAARPTEHASAIATEDMSCMRRAARLLTTLLI